MLLKITDKYYFIKIDLDFNWSQSLYRVHLLIIKNSEPMFTFGQYLGFILFLTVITIGFWLMMFLIGFVQYWIVGAMKELYKERKGKK